MKASSWAEGAVGIVFWTNGVGVRRLDVAEIVSWLEDGCHAGVVVLARSGAEARRKGIAALERSAAFA